MEDRNSSMINTAVVRCYMMVMWRETLLEHKWKPFRKEEVMVLYFEPSKHLYGFCTFPFLIAFITCTADSLSSLAEHSYASRLNGRDDFPPYEFVEILQYDRGASFKGILFLKTD